MKTVWIETDETYERLQIIAVYTTFASLCRNVFGANHKVTLNDAESAEASGEYKFNHNGYARVAVKMQVWE